MAFDKELLDYLVCPKCKNPFELPEDEQALICKTCQLSFPIREDTPILLIDEAESIA